MENPNKLEFETINTNQIFYNNNKNKKIKIQIRSESKPTTISTPQKLQKQNHKKPTKIPHFSNQGKVREVGRKERRLQQGGGVSGVYGEMEE